MVDSSICKHKHKHNHNKYLLRTTIIIKFYIYIKNRDNIIFLIFCALRGLLTSLNTLLMDPAFILVVLMVFAEWKKAPNLISE